jgi:hypothetical protein
LKIIYEDLIKIGFKKMPNQSSINILKGIKKVQEMTDDISTVLDFKVIKEFWDIYDLTDGTKLKNRVILTGVKKPYKNNAINDNKLNELNEYEFDFQSIQSFIFSKKSKGNPHIKLYTKQELDSSYTIEVAFNTISEKWNEYTINDNKTKLKLKLRSTVTQIQKSNIVLQNGDPIYNVKIKILSKVLRQKI